MDSIQRYAGPRIIRHTARVPCQVVRLRDFQLVADCIQNVSDRGVLVGPADPVLTGEPLLVSFKVPGFLDWIDAEAVVRRVAHGRRPGETSRALGLELLDLDDYSERLLATFARRLPPVPPSYRVGSSGWQRRLRSLGPRLHAA